MQNNEIKRKQPPPIVVLATYIIFAIVFIAILEQFSFYKLALRVIEVVFAIIFIVVGTVQYYRIKRGTTGKLEQSPKKRTAITKKKILVSVIIALVLDTIFGIWIFSSTKPYYVTTIQQVTSLVTLFFVFLLLALSAAVFLEKSGGLRRPPF